MFLFVGASQISLYISAFVLGMNYKPLLTFCSSEFFVNFRINIYI